MRMGVSHSIFGSGGASGIYISMIEIGGNVLVGAFVCKVHRSHMTPKTQAHYGLSIGVRKCDSLFFSPFICSVLIQFNLLPPPQCVVSTTPTA